MKPSLLILSVLLWSASDRAIATDLPGWPEGRTRQDTDGDGSADAWVTMRGAELVLVEEDLSGDQIVGNLDRSSLH